MNLKETIEDLNCDPTESFWLKAAVEALMKRDPVDALNDAERLAKIMKLRLDEITPKMGVTPINHAIPRAGVMCINPNILPLVRRVQIRDEFWGVSKADADRFDLKDRDVVEVSLREGSNMATILGKL